MSNLHNSSTIIKENEKSDKILKDSEDLVKVILENRVAITQIRHIYERARTKGRVEFQVFLKYQMGRSDGKILPRVFGDKLLLLYEKYQYQKHDLITILKYVVMLYEYEKTRYNNNFNINDNNKDYHTSQQHRNLQQSKPQSSYNNISPDTRQKIEQIIKNSTREYGFDKIKIDGPFQFSNSYQQGYKEILKLTVYLKRFYGNRKELSEHLKTILLSQISDIQHTCKIDIWIDKDREYSHVI